MLCRAAVVAIRKRLKRPLALDDAEFEAFLKGLRRTKGARPVRKAALLEPNLRAASLVLTPEVHSGLGRRRVRRRGTGRGTAPCATPRSKRSGLGRRRAGGGTARRDPRWCRCSSGRSQRRMAAGCRPSPTLRYKAALRPAFRSTAATPVALAHCRCAGTHPIRYGTGRPREGFGLMARVRRTTRHRSRCDRVPAVCHDGGSCCLALL